MISICLRVGGPLGDTYLAVPCQCTTVFTLSLDYNVGGMFVGINALIFWSSINFLMTVNNLPNYSIVT